MRANAVHLRVVALSVAYSMAVALSSAWAGAYTEDFETRSIFTGFSGYVRTTLAGYAVAPNTSPALHINQGGDVELAFAVDKNSGVAFAPGVYDNVKMEGYVGLGSAGAWGSMSAGFMLRVTTAGDGYAATVHSGVGEPRTGEARVQRMGGWGLGFPILGVGIPNFDPLHEDYRLAFEAKGTLITISLWRERVVDGQVVETFVGSNWCNDSGVQSGQVGLYSWAMVPNYSFYDDITVSGTPPAILAPGDTQTAEVGSTVYFRCTVAGPPGQTCQWFFNSTNRVTGGTSFDLTLPNVQLARSGAYTLVVTNLFGAATSGPAMLNVIPPVQRRPVPAVTITGPVGGLFNLERADLLAVPAVWTLCTTPSLTNGSWVYFDASTPAPQKRFYRIGGDGSAGSPSLKIRMVPAVTISGAVGSTQRLDYINRYGPTDAWLTLATVTLMAPNELYFDTSALGQPERLYRVVPVP